MAAALRDLAGVRVEGRCEEAVIPYKRVLSSEAGIFGTLEQYHSAETDFEVGS